MADERYSFATARTRLEEIVTQVRKKDTSLEKSLDLLEEGVRLANACTELIDHADWAAAEVAPGEAPIRMPQRRTATRPSESRTSTADVAGRCSGGRRRTDDELVGRTTTTSAMLPRRCVGRRSVG